MTSNDHNNQPNVGPFATRQVYDQLPLDPGSQCIRVLDVHQDDSADRSRLTGTLRTVDLQALPHFTALSYVWGQSSNHTIACNGCNINITQSCHEALTSLRASRSSLTIWVDAICINQEDDSEKEQQIMLMGNIYTWAETVYVWLGAGSTVTDQAAEYICAISQFRLFPVQVPRRSDNTRSPIQRRLVRIGRYALRLGFRTCYIESLIAIRDRTTRVSRLPVAKQDVVNSLLDQSWLSRAWTFQEMTLASNPVLVCGRQQIPWLVMHQALTFIEHSATQALTDPVNNLISEIQQQIHVELSHSDSFKKWQALFDVWQTIPRHFRWSRYQSSNVHDETGSLTSSCSVHDCVKALRTEKIFRFKGLSRWSLGIIQVLFIVILITFGSGFSIPIFAPILIVLFFFTDNLVRCSFNCIHGSNARMYGLIYHPGLQPQNYLVALVQALRDRESQRSHDRVYAIGSVLRQLGAHPPTPDYQKPVDQVYLDAFVSLMEWDPTFINLLIDCGSGLPDAPSWVPDWSKNDKKSWLPDSYIYHSIGKILWSDQDFTPSASGNALSVKAACLGSSCYCLTLKKSEVRELRSNEMTTDSKLVRNVQLLAEWVLYIRKDALIFRFHESIPWTVLLTLAGCSIPHSEVTSEQEETFRRMFEILTQLGVQVSSERGDTPAVTAAALRALEAIKQCEYCWELFLDTCNRIAERRGLFVSDNGLIGSGPISIGQGDTISLIQGVSVPMALRKIGHEQEGYQVLGPVFIDGFMELPTENLQRMSLDWKVVRLL
ncbi:hypothetical protein F53441_6639 [Fusarium austroafricanum]|uniref:Heterokaryon incompatibility domain-containing protein n=1 Tax=Fusarium austroafricanum TaxID=2364996 RepID=A0A8H4KF76_9HYPO|nr:hypothetical protein F53441_6639 [Fusarium austroafricanum]